jgi:hypothetical protein
MHGCEVHMAISIAVPVEAAPELTLCAAATEGVFGRCNGFGSSLFDINQFWRSAK